jgi:hypothetical protein
MSEITYKEEAQKLLELRYEISKNFPIENSLIPLDLLLFAALGNNLGDHTVKSLFISLPHSNMGLRYYFQELIELNLLALHKSEEDKRIKIVTPSDLLKEQLQKISYRIKEIYNF